MGKRGQNEGTIRKRKDGRWEARAIIGRTIRSFRSLSKQAQKEWLNKHRYSSSFNGEDELEM